MDEPTNSCLHSNWSVPQILAELPGLRRVDSGDDLLAFRVAGVHPTRAVYVYLYGDDPDVIHFDLEDTAAKTGEWDHAVQRGHTRSRSELRHLVTDWVQQS